MRALTLRQPYAWLTFHGKNPENRVWKTRFRGYFLVHAGRELRLQDYQDAQRMCEGTGVELPPMSAFVAIPQGNTQGLGLGGIVGAVKLIDVLPPLHHGHGPAPRWRILGQYGFELRAQQLLPLEVCSGARQFWRVPIVTAARLEVTPELRGQLEESDRVFTEAHSRVAG